MMKNRADGYKCSIHLMCSTMSFRCIRQPEYLAMM